MDRAQLTRERQPSEAFVVRASGVSLCGGRSSNQDSFLVLDDTNDVVRRRGAGQLFAVADGLGGHLGGGTASRIAVETLVAYYDTPTDEPWASGGARLGAIVRKAHEKVVRRAGEEPALAGMGTTLTAAVFGPTSVEFVHVGDSRLYRVRRGKAECLTLDHSFARRMQVEGIHPPEEYAEGPLGNALYRYVGKHPLQVDRGRSDLRGGDVFLLTTDGFHRTVDESTLEEEIATPGASAEALAKRLSGLCESNDPSDNATVVVITVETNRGNDV